MFYKGIFFGIFAKRTCFLPQNRTFMTSQNRTGRNFLREISEKLKQPMHISTLKNPNLEKAKFNFSTIPIYNYRHHFRLFIKIHSLHNHIFHKFAVRNET